MQVGCTVAPAETIQNPPGENMRKRQSSLSASGIAIIRALESIKPEGERICYDPYARQFANPWLFYFANYFIDAGYAQKRGPGVMEFLVARARYMDDYLQIYMDDGLEQLVILGAGFDPRAYRFEKLKGQVKVFEVDHPATQRVKLEKLKKNGASSRPYHLCPG